MENLGLERSALVGLDFISTEDPKRSMWKAITSDLKTVVSTITTETGKVFGEDEGVGGDGSREREKLLIDLRRSFDTFASPIEEQYTTEFSNFMTKFTLEACSKEIKSLLDEEVDISRNYAELVPHKVTPLQFWGRYFFRVRLVMNEGVLGLDEVVEEEGNWDDATLVSKEEINTAAAAVAVKGTENAGGDYGSKEELLLCQKNLTSCLQENTTLKGHVRVLTLRVRELEALLEQAKASGFDPTSSAPVDKEREKEIMETSASSEGSAIEPLSTSQVVADLGDSDDEESGW